MAKVLEMSRIGDCFGLLVFGGDSDEFSGEVWLLEIRVIRKFCLNLEIIVWSFCVVWVCCCVWFGRYRVKNF